MTHHTFTNKKLTVGLVWLRGVFGDICRYANGVTMQLLPNMGTILGTNSTVPLIEQLTTEKVPLLYCYCFSCYWTTQYSTAVPLTATANGSGTGNEQLTTEKWPINGQYITAQQYR